MAKTQDLRRRIRSIQNTQQLTRAMKTVSAAKLKRAQDRILRARPYAHQMLAVLRSLAARANPERHPLLRERPQAHVGLVVVTSDRGLCGSFNANICRVAHQFARRVEAGRLTILCVGRKGRDYFSRRGFDMGHQWVDVTRTVDYPLAQEIARYLMERYVEEAYDAIYVAYNEFKSALQQRPIVERLLPIERAEIEPLEREDYIYEPNPQALFDILLPRHVEVQMFRVLLESAAAEHAARMTAMDSATRNAEDLIERLTLYMNRVRQAAITTEIIEVVSGAEALGR